MGNQRIISAAVVVLGLGLIGNCSKDTKSPTTPENPVCSLSATTLSFGAVTVGTSIERTFTVSNTGGGTLAGTAATSSAGYSVVSGGSFSLGAGQQATVTVRFSPPGPGTYSGGIGLIGTDCPGISCSASGQAAAPICELSHTSLAFGTIAGACATEDRVFVIRNAGTGTLSGTVSSACAQFQILGDPAYSLGPGERDTITVRFSPDGYGSFSCNLTTGCDNVVSCSGLSERFLPCGSISPQFIDFGTVYVGQTITRTVTLNAVSTPFDLAWVSEGNPNFDGPPGQRFIQPDDIISFPVGFTPQTEGQHTAWFAAQCKTAIGDGQYHAFGCVTATGTAVVAAGSPQCQLSTTSLNFGTVAVGSSVDRTLTVTNSGGGVLNGSAQPSGCNEYTVQEDPTVSLGPGQSKTYTIRFRPTQRGVAITCYVFPFDPICGVVTLSGQGQ